MVQGQTVRRRHTEDSEYAFAFSGKNRQQALNTKRWSASNGENSDPQPESGLSAAVSAGKKDCIAVCDHLSAKDQTKV
jgi:hypothetical protein